MPFSVGIGLTNECNLRCAHCYRPEAVTTRLTFDDVRAVCEAIAVRSMNLGVGENGLHPDYRRILDYLWERRITTSITSNGLSLQELGDAEVKRFNSVECSLDFPTEAEHDAFRGRGNWRTVVAALERCAGLGVPVTVTVVMMRINWNRLPDLARLASEFHANLRVNIYQPARTDRFTLDYEHFWEGLRALLGSARLVGTTEPVLAGVLGLEGFTGPACGRSTVRVAPDRRVLPCTYWPESTITLDDLAALGDGIVKTREFVEASRPAGACAGCPCRGGCAARRALLGGLDAPDPYCPFARGDTMRLDWAPATRQDLPKLSSACTTVVSAG